MPDVSVIIPARDGAAFVADAVASVRAQGVDAEVVVIDDGSTDHTARVARALGVIVLATPGLGPAAARNAGLERATADRVAFLDVDDAWPPGSLAALAAALDGVDVATGLVQQQLRGADGWRDHGAPLRLTSLCGALYRREVLDRVGPLDPTLRTAEDLEWWSRANDAGVRVARIDVVTLLHRRHDRNVTLDRARLAADALAVVRRRVRS